MKFIEFDYTKADGSKSHRVILSEDPPLRKHVFGVDITGLSNVEQALFAAEMAQANKAYIEKCISIRAKFDVTHNLRQFDPEKMTNMVIEIV